MENACEKAERAGGLSPATDERPGAAAIGDATIAARFSSRGGPVRLGARCCDSMTKGAVAIGVAHRSEAELMTPAAAGPSCWQRPSDDAAMDMAAHDPTHARAVGAPLSMNAMAKVMARATNGLPRRLGGQVGCHSHRRRGLAMRRFSRMFDDRCRRSGDSCRWSAEFSAGRCRKSAALLGDSGWMLAERRNVVPTPDIEASRQP